MRKELHGQAIQTLISYEKRSEPVRNAQSNI